MQNRRENTKVAQSTEVKLHFSLRPSAYFFSAISAVLDFLFSFGLYSSKRGGPGCEYARVDSLRYIFCNKRPAIAFFANETGFEHALIVSMHSANGFEYAKLAIPIP